MHLALIGLEPAELMNKVGDLRRALRSICSRLNRWETFARLPPSRMGAQSRPSGWHEQVQSIIAAVALQTPLGQPSSGLV
jgi:hypothetical protein